MSAVGLAAATVDAIFANGRTRGAAKTADSFTPPEAPASPTRSHGGPDDPLE